MLFKLQLYIHVRLCMQNDDKLKLLDNLINGSISMEEAFAAAKETKETSAVREQFVTEVGLESWDDAVATVPQYANQLKKFRGSKGKEPAFKVLLHDFLYQLCNIVSNGISYFKEAT